MVIDNQAISKTVDAIKNSEGGRQKIGEKNLQILYLTNQFRQILYFSINICCADDRVLYKKNKPFFFMKCEHT